MTPRAPVPHGRPPVRRTGDVSQGASAGPRFDACHRTLAYRRVTVPLAVAGHAVSRRRDQCRRRPAAETLRCLGTRVRGEVAQVGSRGLVVPSGRFGRLDLRTTASSRARQPDRQQSDRPMPRRHAAGGRPGSPRDTHMNRIVTQPLSKWQPGSARTDAGNLLLACVAEATGTFLLVLVGTAVAAVLGKGTAGPAYNSLAVGLSCDPSSCPSRVPSARSAART